MAEDVVEPQSPKRCGHKLSHPGGATCDRVEGHTGSHASMQSNLPRREDRVGFPTVTLGFGDSIHIQQVHGGFIVLIDGVDESIVFSEWAKLIDFLATQVVRQDRPLGSSEATGSGRAKRT